MWVASYLTKDQAQARRRRRGGEALKIADCRLKIRGLSIAEGRLGLPTVDWRVPNRQPTIANP